MKKLLILRKKLNLTQKEAAQKLGISRRSYQYYEQDDALESTEKYIYLCNKLENALNLDENHGILELNAIKEACITIFRNYSITLCYLIGSYAKETAKETSDVNLVVDGEILGYDYYSLSNDLRKVLKKRITLLRLNDLEHSFNTIKEVLHNGIKLY